jgi:hypothetical protein
VVIIKNAELDMAAVTVRCEGYGVPLSTILADVLMYFRPIYLYQSRRNDAAAETLVFATNGEEFDEGRDVVCCQTMSGRRERLANGELEDEEVDKFFRTRMPWLVVLPSFMNGKSSFQGRSCVDLIRLGERFLHQSEPETIEGWESQPTFASLDDMSEDEFEEVWVEGGGQCPFMRAFRAFQEELDAELRRDAEDRSGNAA